MRNDRPPPISLTDTNVDLAPPQPQFVSDADSGTEIRSRVSHSRTASFTADSPSVSPRSATFTTSVNPFSPAASLRSFTSDSAMATPTQNLQYYPFPESPADSHSELPRVSSFYGSRPTTSDGSLIGSTRPSSTTRFREPFALPPSRPVTLYSAPSSAKLLRERPKSTMLDPNDNLQKPWISSRDTKSWFAYFLTYGVCFLGVILGAIKCYFDWQSVPVIKGNLCMVLDEDFSNPDEVFGDNGKFFREVDMSGFGNGEFEMTTASTNNSFVVDGHLYLVPTLTSDSIPLDAILDGHVYNISDCTFNITQGVSYTDPLTYSPTLHNTSAIGQDSFDAQGYYKACSAVSNATTGHIINPVQSARLSTRKTASIRYGKVEVRAKIPTGDWLWPAIWMMPVDNTYGGWPLSGKSFTGLTFTSLCFIQREIDIMESRGNGPDYVKEGANYVRGSLNWGPTFELNRVFKTTGLWKLRRGSYDQDFHTYTLEWTEDFIRISVDTRLHHLLDLRVKQSFWDRGTFPPVVRNGSDDVILENPWINGAKSAPFDQRFYLILNVGVGGTNGWFPDGGSGKPWLDGSPTAMRDFLLAKDQWYPTWPQDIQQRAMVVDSVKMWQQC
ncbi:GH16 beta-1,3-glucan recognition protein [Mycena floridula]|nr:GH16 beta-1,3-glucan recognition protein [Mycena floridula]